MDSNESKKEIQKLNDLIIDSRELLSIFQKIRIESARSKGWILGDLLGASIFTIQSKYNSQSKIHELVKDAKTKSIGYQESRKALDLNFELSNFTYITDYLISSSLANLIQYSKISQLKKDIIKHSEELEKEIELLEKEEERLIRELGEDD